MTCTVTGCDRLIANKTHGYCDPHYKRYWRTGDVQAHIPLAEPRRAPLKPIDHEDGTRTCADCASRLPLEAGFHRDSRGPLGYRPTCKTCRTTKETERYRSDPETHRARMRQHRQDNLQHVRARDAANYHKHRAKRIEAAIANAHVRRARMQSNGIERGISISALRKMHGDMCHYCGVEMVFTRSHKPGARPQNLATLEHLTPIARGGGHTWDNCRLSCWACNISKGAKDYPTRLMMGAQV